MICLEFGHVEAPFYLKPHEKFAREQLIKFKS